MNDKVTVVISDDSDDDICAIYSISKEGVIIIDDSRTNILNTPCSEVTNVNENRRSSRLRNKFPCTSGDTNESASLTSSEKTVKTRSEDRNITKKSQSPVTTEPLKTSSCLNSLSNPDSKGDPLKSTDQNKLPSTSNCTKHTRSFTNNKSNAVQASAHREVFTEPKKRQFTEDPNFKVAIKNNLSDGKGVNLQHKRSVSPSTNRDSPHTSHKQRRTQSPPVRKISNESRLLEQKSKQCSKNTNSNSDVNKNLSLQSNSTCEKTRTKTAPCSVSLLNKSGHTSHQRNRTQSAPCKTVEKTLNENRVQQSNSHGNISGASTSTFPQTSAASNVRQALSSLQNSNLPTDSIKNLSRFSHIIFIDLDNWGKFFNLPYPLPSNIFVWGFCGGNYMQKRRFSTVHFQELVREKRFFQHPKCGKAKNAADFALCMHAARLDLQLPIHIPFTVLSGDGDFSELKTQLAPSARQIHLVNPHHKDPGFLHAILASIGQK